MAISLKKGQKVDLTKGNPSLKKITVGLGWDVNRYDGQADFDLDAVWEAMRHDKKAVAGSTDIVTVDEIGQGKIERVTTEQLKARFDAAYREG